MQDSKQVVVLKLGDILYGFPIEQVNEIIRYIPPTKMPNADGFLEGIVSLRGKIHVAINLRSYLGMERVKADKNTKIIIANGSNLGFIVDDVNRIVTPQEEEIESASNLPSCIDKSHVLYILKTRGDIIVVLNMASMLAAGMQEKKAV